MKRDPGSGWDELLRRQGDRASATAAWNDGAECPSDFELAAVAEGELPPERARAVREHLGRCGRCLLLVQGALEEVGRSAEGRAGGPRLLGRPHGWKRVGWVAAAAAALLFALVLLRSGERGADIGRLAKLEALPAVMPRGPAEAEAELAFRAGLERYLRGDWAGAEVRFRDALGSDAGRDDARLYLGSCFLLTGRGEEAVAVLDEALPGWEGGMAEEGRWQLAQACLTVGDGERARALLEELARGGGRRTDEARTQLVELP